MIVDFRLRGSRPCRRMGGHLTKGGCAHRWCTILTITNLHYQRAKPSPLWCGLCLEIRIGRGLARIPRVLFDKARCGAGPARPRLARRVGGAARQGEMVHTKIHHLPSPSRGRSLHIDPCGNAVESSRRPTRRTQATDGLQGEREKPGGYTRADISDPAHGQLGYVRTLKSR